MTNLAVLAQVIVALSVFYVWVFRLENVEKEFREYGLNNTIRNSVGAAKIALGTLLLVGIWYPPVVLVSSLLMAFLMVCAQIAHYRARHAWQKYLPSFLLLLLSLFSAAVASGRLR